MSNIKALTQAFREERKAFLDDQAENTIIGFMKKYWNMFASDKQTFYGTLKSLENKEANAFLDLLGLATVRIYKCSESEVSHACYDMTSSKLWRIFNKDLAKRPDCTDIFMVTTSAIIVTNQYKLEVPGTFVHKYIAEGAANDIYWCPITEVADTLKFY